MNGEVFLKKLSAVILSIAMLGSVAVTDFAESFNITASAYERVDGYPDFDPDIYEANLLTSDNSTPATALILKLNQDTPAKLLADSIKSNSTLMSEMSVWKVATFQPSNAVGENFNEENYYEGLIVSALKLYTSSSVVSDVLDNEYIQEATSFFNNFKDILQFSYGIDYVSNSVSEEAIAKIDAKDLEQCFDDSFAETFSDLDTAGDMVEKFTMFVKAGETLEQAVNNWVLYFVCTQLQDGVKDLINDLYQNCDQSNYNLREALSKLNKSCKGYREAFEVANFDTNLRTVETAAEIMLDKMYGEALTSNPYTTAFLIGQAVGTGIADFLCNTSEIVSQSYNIIAFSEFEALLKKTTYQYISNYKNNPTRQNAKKLISAVDALYTNFETGCDIAQGLYDVIYRDNRLNNLLAVVDTSISATYENATKSITYIKTSSQEDYQNIRYNFYYWGLKDDYPEIYYQALENGDFVDTINATATGNCGANGNDVKYALYENGLLVIDGTGDFNLNSFNNSNHVKKIIIRDGITSIPARAFYDCDNLTNVTIPDGVTAIWGSAFAECDNLTSVTLPNSLSIIGDRTFYNCRKLTNINYPLNLTYMGEDVYKNCPIKKMTVPEGVNVLVEKAFYGMSSLEQVELPNTLTKICGFQYCGKLKNITIPKNVTEIGAWSFYDCNSLTDITIPDGVTAIWGMAFAECDNLTSVTLPNSLRIIGDRTFYNCRKLTNINYPLNLTYMGEDGYENCPIKEMTVPEGVKVLAEKAFYGMSSLEQVKLPSTLTKICGFQYCGKLKNITIPKNVTEIGAWSFYDCNSLTDITIPDGVTAIWGMAFAECDNLTSVTLPNSLSIIGDNTFSNCKKLTIYGQKDSYAESYAKKNNIPFVALLSNQTKISKDKIALGGTVVINAKADGGNGDYTYAVYYKKKTESKWTTKQDFSTKDTVTIKPAYATDYDICVKVKDGTGKAVKKYFELKVNAKLANTSTLSAENITLGQKVTANCLAQGGMGEYQYQVVYKQTAQTAWTTAQAFSENATVTFKPAKATSYDVCVKVKDSNGTIVKKFFTVQVNAKLTNTSAVSATTIKKGNTITVNGSATGGAGDYTYAVFYKQKEQSKWTTKQDFNENAVISVKPAQATDYNICVKVKDKDGTIVKKYFTVTVTK